MKYECCACGQDFPTTSAVDGFAQGYRVGFLCPHCGANLQDNLIDTHRVIRKDKGAYALLGVAMLGMGVVKVMSLEGPIALAIMLAVFALVGIVLWKYPSLREEPIGSTRLGPGKTMKPRELASKSHSTQRD